LAAYPQIWSRRWRENRRPRHSAFMYPSLEAHPDLQRLAVRQQGVLHRGQFDALGVAGGFVAAQIAAQRWMPVGHKVVLLQNAPPTREQLMHIAVHDAGSLVALASHTALELAGFTGFGKEAGEIHLVVPRGAKVTRLPGVRLHESRRLRSNDVIERRGLPCTKVERSAIDAGAWQPFPRFACLILAAVVQQGLTSAPRLSDALRDVGRVRHKAYMRLALSDIGQGAQSLGELDLAAVCRKFDLVPPDRQQIRRDSRGRPRYLDAEWRLPSGEVVVLEIDGSHHLDVANWQADIKSERAIVTSRRWVLRATTLEIRLEPGSVVADLRALGVPTNTELSEAQRAMAS
jgi:hypothetical protein